VTKEFLAHLTTSRASIATPRVQNLAAKPDDATAQHRPGGIKRTGSKDSVVTVPGNTFCLQFLKYLVNGGAGDDSVAADSLAGRPAALTTTGREAPVGGTTAATAAVDSPGRPPAGTSAAPGEGGGGSGSRGGGGRLVALNPASVFNQGSNWIDSLAEDMSSVLEGHDSTDIDTEGDTTFDEDHDGMSSYSRTDGEDEEEEFALSHDDNSYNAGWWTGQGGRADPKKKEAAADKKPWKKRRDPGHSLLD
jgi:hypothetical protein